MKTKLLIAALCLGAIVTTKAQVLYSNDFTAAAGLSIIDADGDTKNWGLYSGNATTALWGLTGNFAGSASWEPAPVGALSPDNYLFTAAAINIPNNLSTTTLSFKMGSSDTSFFAEHLSVYLVPGASTTAADIIAYCEANTPVFDAVLAAENARTALTQTVDVSSFAGSAVKIIFRHHDTTDMNLLYIDDVLLSQSNLATEGFASSQFAVYPNPATNVISIDAKQNGQISAVSFTDLNGRIVKQNNVQNLSKVELNISELSAGVYMMNVTSDKGTATKKIVKN